MGKLTNKFLPDVQLNKEVWNPKSIQKVGVRGVKIHLPIKMKDGSVQDTIAVVSSYASQEPTSSLNMSRCAETIYQVLKANSTGDGFNDMKEFCRVLKEKHNSTDVYCKARFELLFDSKTPMSDRFTTEPVKCTLETKYINGEYRNYLTLDIIGFSLCPCAKELASLWTNTTEEEHKIIDSIEDETLKWKIKNSGYASHSQKSRVTATIELKEGERLWIEDVIEMANKSFSTPTTMMAKRCDEAYVVQTAYLGGYFDDDKKFNKVEYAGPKFVEDIIRYMAKFLDDEMDKRLKDYVIVVENYESLHSQDETAVAVLNAGRELN